MSWLNRVAHFALLQLRHVTQGTVLREEPVQNEEIGLVRTVVRDATADFGGGGCNGAGVVRAAATGQGERPERDVSKQCGSEARVPAKSVVAIFDALWAAETTCERRLRTLQGSQRPRTLSAKSGDLAMLEGTAGGRGECAEPHVGIPAPGGGRWGAIACGSHAGLQPRHADARDPPPVWSCTPGPGAKRCVVCRRHRGESKGTTLLEFVVVLEDVVEDVGGRCRKVHVGVGGVEPVGLLAGEVPVDKEDCRDKVWRCGAQGVVPGEEEPTDSWPAEVRGRHAICGIGAAARCNSRTMARPRTISRRGTPSKRPVYVRCTPIATPPMRLPMAMSSSGKRGPNQSMPARAKRGRLRRLGFPALRRGRVWRAEALERIAFDAPSHSGGSRTFRRRRCRREGRSPSSAGDSSRSAWGGSLRDAGVKE